MLKNGCSFIFFKWYIFFRILWLWSLNEQLLFEAKIMYYSNFINVILLFKKNVSYVYLFS